MLEIDVHIKVKVPEKEIGKAMKYAHKMGYDYGDDPGRKELIRRLIIAEGVYALSEIDAGHQFEYSVVEGD